MTSNSKQQLKEIFQRSPTRELEEVEKVNSLVHAERDVREFCETESAKKVLARLGDIVKQLPEGDPRFMYIHATFGSGKTLLLKLIGFATGENKGRNISLQNFRIDIRDLMNFEERSPIPQRIILSLFF